MFPLIYNDYFPHCFRAVFEMQFEVERFGFFSSTVSKLCQIKSVGKIFLLMFANFNNAFYN